MVRFPSSNDISLEINGKTLAVAQSYQAKTTRESRYIEAFGAPEPVGTIGGKVNHLLELTRVCLTGSALEDGINFHELDKFNVVIVKPHCRIIYSDCRWAEIHEKAALGSAVLESVRIVAAKRMEVV